MTRPVGVCELGWGFAEAETQREENERSCGWISVAYAVLAAGLAPAATFDPAPRVRIEGDQAFARLGIAVAPAGDVNDDGYGDALVGTTFWGLGPEEAEGASFVFLGGAPAACQNGVDDDGAPPSITNAVNDDVLALDGSGAARVTIRGGSVSGGGALACSPATPSAIPANRDDALRPRHRSPPARTQRRGRPL